MTIQEWKAILELNPLDNQAVRYSLLAGYLALDRLDDARKLFAKYPEECSWNTLFAWGRVLERLLSGDAGGATEALAVARKQNPFTEAYLKDHRELPKSPPAGYQPGARTEALCFADRLRMAWGPHKEAQHWLLKQPKPPR